MLAALLSLLGCAKPVHRLPPTEANLPPPSPASLLLPLDRHWQLVKVVRAMARLTVTSPQGRHTTRQTFLWQRPTPLRLDIIGILGQPAMTLVADKQRLAVYYPQQGIVVQGPATAANLMRFTGLPLDAEEVAHLLVGDVHPVSSQAEADILVQHDHGAYLVRFLKQSGELFQDVWIEPDQGLASRVVRYTAHASPVVDVSYADFRRLTEDVWFPFQVVVWLPRVETELRLQFLTVDLNPDLPHTVFELSPPTGVRVVPLE